MKSFAVLALSLILAACGSGGGENVTSAPANSVAAVAAPAGQKWAETVTKTEEGYLLGNPDAPVKLVEYGARLCPACKAFATSGFEPLIQTYVSTGKVSFEFRDFLIHGPAELGLAAMARCVDKSAFFPILEQTYAEQDALNAKLMALTPAQQQALQGASPAQVVTRGTDAMGGIDFMKQRGLPEAKARACMADEKLLNEIAAVTQKRGQDGTVSGTPTLLVNGTKIDSIAWADVEKALKNAGA